MNITFDTFNLKSPYIRFDKNNIEKDIEVKNWQHPDSVPVFNKLISEVKPSIIIELGSFMGWSAITMAKICRTNNINTKILCIDTWLGSIEHWRIDQCNELSRYDYFQNGISGMYDAFCKNVISHGVEEYVIPLPNTTDMMFNLLKHLNITSQLIYVDASHEYRNVLQDLQSYYEILDVGGYIFGDDVRWNSVNKAIQEFSNNMKLDIRLSDHGNLFYFKK